MGTIMTTDGLTMLIVLMGTATVLLSCFVAWRFWYHHRHLKDDGKRLTVALFAQLVGEAVIGIVTLVFAMLAWSGKLPGVPVEAQSLLRFIAFLATSATTIHLALVVEQLHRND
jgi:hypothetical protein